MRADKFIPTTMEREIAPNIVFRPIRSWHSGTYAGEKLLKIPGKNDGSGCMKKIWNNGYELEVCNIPYTVTHRLYWNKNNPDNTISAFLSYPDGMGAMDEYFWETLGTSEDGDIERFRGEGAEKEMEEKIIKTLSRKMEASE